MAKRSTKNLEVNQIDSEYINAYNALVALFDVIILAEGFFLIAWGVTNDITGYVVFFTLTTILIYSIVINGVNTKLGANIHIFIGLIIVLLFMDLLSVSKEYRSLGIYEHKVFGAMTILAVIALLVYIPCYKRYLFKEEEKIKAARIKATPVVKPIVYNAPVQSKPIIAAATMPTQKNTPAPIKKAITFNDIAGYTDTKNDMKFIVDCLKSPSILQQAGAKIPKGIILYGPPGTGKTLMAKAIAGTAGVPFFSTNASSFINTYVGTGPAAIRELYSKAKAHAPAVVFIDEIDAIGSRTQGGNDSQEYRLTINALLSEMDGMDSSDSIITIAATNFLDSLDEALIRPGRFDRKILVPLPSRSDRVSILKLHGHGKTFSGVDFEEIADLTAGFSGAALATLLNEAAIKAASNRRTFITRDDIDKSLYSQMTGAREGQKAVGDVKLTAYHEAGHAIVREKLGKEVIGRISVYASDNGLAGYTFGSGNTKAGLLQREDLENQIKGMYGGRAAEEIYLGGTGNISTGSHQDLKEATAMIKDYLTEYGLGDSLINTSDLFGISGTKEQFAEDANALANRLYQETKDFLISNRSLLDEVAAALVEKNVLTAKEFDNIVTPKDDFYR